MSGFGPIWMEDLMCTGNEDDIALCKFTGWGKGGKCTHLDDVALTCGEEIKVKMIGGKGDFEGGIEITNDTEWFPVCKEGFSMSTATVVCQHFGYPASENDPTVKDMTDFVQLNITTHAYRVQCTGGEFDVALCNITVQLQCPYNEYVAVRCARTELRLITDSSPSAGRVEVYHNGRWGSICGHSFDIRAASVICRMFGFKSEGANFYTGNKFGKSKDMPWIDSLKCSGSEKDISSCHLNWTEASCNEFGNVAVSCVQTDVRLVNGAGPWEGRVEVIRNGQWGTICDSSFGVKEASVICQMIGFKAIDTKPRAMKSSFFGPSSLSKHLSMMSCEGSELDVNACIQGIWGEHTCSNLEEAGVDCRETNIRLTGGSHNMEGRVEIIKRGQWVAICDEDWDDVEATIVCKTLAAFPFDRQVIGKALKGSFFGAGQGMIGYNRVKCNGSEKDIMHCKLQDIKAPICDHSQEAGVACSYVEQVMLSHTRTEGTISVNVNNIWNNLCDTEFGQEEAKVICRELGYWSSTSKTYGNSWFGIGNGTSQDVRLQCNGDETKIAFCPMQIGWNLQHCSHSKDAGVQCIPSPIGIANIRLVNGRYPGMGRVEVKYNNNWGSFCYRHWQEHNTDVVCKMLKYNTLKRSFPTQRNGSAVLIGNLQCNGHETDIGYCKAQLDKSTCTEQVVGIDCTGNLRVQLNDGQNILEGRVDIFDGHRWGSLCDNIITSDEAQVICSTATGYRNTEPSFIHEPLEFHQTDFAMNKLTCGGWEEHISQCTFTKTSTCNLHFTHVRCFGDCVHFHFEQSGEITSENYGSQFYKPGIDCLYIIKPPKAVYKIEVVDLQMADDGDYIQVNDAPNGQIIGHYSGFFGRPFLLFSEQFYIRYKTDAQGESKGFNLTWSVASAADTVKVTCVRSGWGAYVNLTSLKYLHPDAVQPEKIVINLPNCYGFVYADQVIFTQNYTTCSSNRTVTGAYVTYKNKLVYLDHGINKWTVPLECKRQRTTRIANFHLYSNKRTLSVDNKQDFNFSMAFYYDKKLMETEGNPYAFRQLYVYEITLMENDEDLTFEVERCTTHQSKNGQTLFRQHVENAKPINNDVTLTKQSREKTLVTIAVTEDVATMFTCDVKIVVQ